MDLFSGHTALPRRLRSPVIAIGNFDGVHRGHLELFRQARMHAARLGGETVVLTFDPHPARVLAPAYAPPLITTRARKLELIADAGVDAVVLEPFDRALAARSPAQFVGDVLAAGLTARHVVVGYDFTFGERRAGNVELLGALGAEHGFGVTVVPPVTVDGIVCSSTKVREFVLAGRVDGAALVLGRDVELEGEVVRGAARGRTIGVPTANLRPDTELTPHNGVYAGWAETLPSGPRHLAAINVGTNPTFVSGLAVTIEAHLLDFDGDLYGRRLRLGFVQRLRAEERFTSVEALVEQIGRDIEQARALMAARPARPT